MKQTVKVCNYKTFPQVNVQVNELEESHKLMRCNKLEKNSSSTAKNSLYRVGSDGWQSISLAHVISCCPFKR